VLPENLARVRKSRNLSQEELAQAASISVDTIGRIERGERRTTRPVTIAKLSEALGVSTDALLGLARDQATQNDIGLADLRRAITATAEIPGMTDFADLDEVADPEALASTANSAWRAYVAGRHVQLLHALPILLVDARRAVHDETGDKRAAANRVLCVAYRLGAGIAGRFGLDDLSWTSAERALSAARFTGSPEIESAISLRYLAWTLVRQGRTQEAEHVAIRAAEQIEPKMLDRDPARAGVFGNLIFNAAAAALRSGRSEQADDLLAVAQAAAVRVGRDTASESAIFGPRVAAFQLIDHTVRAGEPAKALHLAEHIPPTRGAVPSFWESGHRLHLAHAAMQTRQYERALVNLIEARGLAPDWVRRQPLGTTVMRALVDRATRRRGKEFGALAAHFGVVATST
jgi:transcriptional regulator with XRE-family HTH domain